MQADSLEKTLMLGKIEGRPSPEGLQTINAGEDVEEMESSYIVGGNAN